MNHHYRILGSFGVVVILLGAAYLSFGIPIACGGHGCVRSIDVEAQRGYDTAFARSTNAHEPSEQATLTTLMRRYLVMHASTTSRVSSGDAVKYRTEILHTTDDEAVKSLGFSSLQEYDRVVLIPFLMQESIMQERHIDNPSALYKQLAQEQRIFLFKKGYVWNRATGEVVAK